MRFGTCKRQKPYRRSGTQSPVPVLKYLPTMPRSALARVLHVDANIANVTVEASEVVNLQLLRVTEPTPTVRHALARRGAAAWMANVLHVKTRQGKERSRN